MHTFYSTPINVVFPSGYLAIHNSIIDQYGEYANDAGTCVKTIWTRQDTIDPDSRRASQLHNESPTLLTSGRMLVMNIYPSTGILSAVNNGQLSGVYLVPSENLESFIADNLQT